MPDRWNTGGEDHLPVQGAAFPDVHDHQRRHLSQRSQPDRSGRPGIRILRSAARQGIRGRKGLHGFRLLQLSGRRRYDLRALRHRRDHLVARRCRRHRAERHLQGQGHRRDAEALRDPVRRVAGHRRWRERRRHAETLRNRRRHGQCGRCDESGCRLYHR